MERIYGKESAGWTNDAGRGCQTISPTEGRSLVNKAGQEDASWFIYRHFVDHLDVIGSKDGDIESVVRTSHLRNRMARTKNTGKVGLIPWRKEAE